MNRAVKQLVKYGKNQSLLALCEDGSLWRYARCFKELPVQDSADVKKCQVFFKWIPLPPIPEGDINYEDKKTGEWEAEP